MFKCKLGVIPQKYGELKRELGKGIPSRVKRDIEE